LVVRTGCLSGAAVRRAQLFSSGRLSSGRPYFKYMIRTVYLFVASTAAADRAVSRFYTGYASAAAFLAPGTRKGRGPPAGQRRCKRQEARDKRHEAAAISQPLPRLLCEAMAWACFARKARRRCKGGHARRQPRQNRPSATAHNLYYVKCSLGLRCGNKEAHTSNHHLMVFRAASVHTTPRALQHVSVFLRPVRSAM